MSYLFLGFSLLFGLLLIISKGIFYKNYEFINLKLKKPLDNMLRIIYLAPVIVLCIILILFFTYFKSKGYIRLSHAWLVVNFWIYSVIFYYIYIELVKIRKLIILLPLIGMITSAFLAIYLTPLQRYESVFHNLNLLIPNIFGLIMLMVSFYINSTLLKKKLNNDL